MNSGPLTLQFKQKKMQMELKNKGNTNNEGGKNSYHSHYNLFINNSKCFCLCIQFSPGKITIESRTTKIVPLHFCPPLIHLEPLTLIQFDFLDVEALPTQPAGQKVHVDTGSFLFPQPEEL